MDHLRMDTYLRCQCVSVVGFFNYIYIVRAAAPTTQCFSLLHFLFLFFFFPREFVGKIVMLGFQVLRTEYYNVYLHRALGPSTIVCAALQPNLQRGSEDLEINAFRLPGSGS